VDENDDRRQPIDRALREEFDGIKPYEPRRYESREERNEHARRASLARWTQVSVSDES
jgi:hypothetical protein